LWDVDIALFERMKGHYQSPKEENFFRNLEFKQLNKPTVCNELLVSEHDNADEIYLVRIEYEEYLVGHGLGNQQEEEHVMNLSEALAINLKNIGFQRGITMWQWLKENDYKFVRYDRDYENFQTMKTNGQW
jgi:hypothetical protein